MGVHWPRQIKTTKQQMLLKWRGPKCRDTDLGHLGCSWLFDTWRELVTHSVCAKEDLQPEKS